MLTEKKLNEETLWKQQKNVKKDWKNVTKSLKKMGMDLVKGLVLLARHVSVDVFVAADSLLPFPKHQVDVGAQRGVLCGGTSHGQNRRGYTAKRNHREDSSHRVMIQICGIRNSKFFLWRATEFKCLHWSCIPQIHGGAQMGEIWLLLGLHGGLRVGQLDVTLVPVLILLQTRILMTPTKKNDLTNINNEEKQQKGSCQWSDISFNVHFIHHSTADLHMPIDQPIHLQNPSELQASVRQNCSGSFLFSVECVLFQTFLINQKINQSINRSDDRPIDQSINRVTSDQNQSHFQCTSKSSSSSPQGLIRLSATFSQPT